MPSWSKDGHWILFDSSADIYKVPAEGGWLC
jgi:Tol biopolymer transport system component